MSELIVMVQYMCYVLLKTCVVDGFFCVVKKTCVVPMMINLLLPHTLLEIVPVPNLIPNPSPKHYP